MNDPTLSKVLKWSIENSSASATAEGGPRTKLTAEDLAAVMGQVTSEPQQMDENMAIIRYPGMDQANRIRALLNYQQIIENLDNANLMQTKGHWEPMITLLEEEDDEIRRLAAWCLGTAVQNNRNTQERLLIVGAIPPLVRLATEDLNQAVRKKAIMALSSGVRNFQPSLDAAMSHMPTEYKPREDLDANDMESVDLLINKLRESLK